MSIGRLAFIPAILTAVVLMSFVFTHLSSFTAPYDGEYWWNRYENSQYTQGEHSDYILSDAEYYAVKGYRFILNGADPTSFPASHPPLASYLIGVSILLFHNQNAISLLVGLICVWLFYKIAKLLLKSSFWSWLLTLLFVSEPIFLTQLNDSMLDIFQLLFTLSAIYFYFRWIVGGPTPKWIILSQFFLGLMLGTKFFLGNLPLVMALYFATVLTGNFKLFKAHTISLVFVFLGFCLGHLTYFFYHPSLIDFLKYQRYILSWWAGSPQVPAFQVWDLIFNNRWHTWWGTMDIVSVPEWRLTWPLITVLALAAPLTCLPLLRGRSTKWGWGLIPLVAIYLWILGNLFLFSFEALYARHLLFIFPALYLLSAVAISTTLMTYRVRP